MCHVSRGRPEGVLNPARRPRCRGRVPPARPPAGSLQGRFQARPARIAARPDRSARSSASTGSADACDAAPRPAARSRSPAAGRSARATSGRSPAGIAVLIVLMWVRHGGAARAGLAGRHPDRDGPARRAAGHVRGAPPAGAHVAQPVPRPGGRPRSPGLAAPLARVRHGLAHRRRTSSPRRRATPSARAAACSTRLLTFLGTYPFVPAAAAGFALFVLVTVSSVRAARRRLVVRDLVRPPPLRLPRRSPSRSPTSSRSGPTSSTTPWPSPSGSASTPRRRALVLAFRVGQPLALAARHRFRVANVVVEAPGRRLDLRDRARPRPARRPRRPVLPASAS